MALEADRNQIAIFVSAAVSFRNNVVDRLSRTRPAVPQTLMADVPVALEDACADNIPFTAVAALVPALPALMLLPAFVTVSLAIT